MGIWVAKTDAKTSHIPVTDTLFQIQETQFHFFSVHSHNCPWEHALNRVAAVIQSVFLRWVLLIH